MSSEDLQLPLPEAHLAAVGFLAPDHREWTFAVGVVTNHLISGGSKRSQAIKLINLDFSAHSIPTCTGIGFLFESLEMFFSRAFNAAVCADSNSCHSWSAE